MCKKGLQELRESLDLSRGDIRDSLGINVQRLYKYEKSLCQVPIQIALLLTSLYKVKIKDIDWDKKGELSEKSSKYRKMVRNKIKKQPRDKTKNRRNATTQ